MACPNTCASQLHERLVHNNTPLYGPWAGWRMAGRVLVSPDGDRISPERLRGILFVESNRLRLHQLRMRAAARLATLPAREQFAGRA